MPLKAKEGNGEFKMLQRTVWFISGGIIVLAFFTVPALDKLNEVAASVGDNRNNITKNEVNIKNHDLTLSKIDQKLEKIWNKLK